jgi:phosphoribosylamine--glycine ligase
MSERTKDIGKGLVDIVAEYEPHLRWADLIFLADNTHTVPLRTVDQVRRLGVAVCGATRPTSDWELDRSLGMAMFEEYGVPVPEHREFSDFDQAIAYVKKQDRPFVSKPSGDADKALSYVAKTPADLVYMLERWKKSTKLKPPFILQERVDGIEMAVGGWLGPHGFNRGWCENFEFKKLCNGDLGCATGEQGTVLRYVAKSKLARQVLKPFEQELVDEGYTGYVDVNCIIDDAGKPWPLEFTMRPGWPTFSIQQELHTGDCVEWLAALCDGTDAGNAVLDTVAVGVVMSIPDYPYSHITRKEVTGIPVYGYEADEEHLHACEMMMTEAPDPETMKPVKMPGTAGDYVLVASGSGDTVRAARDTVYRRLKKLIVPNSPMYRTDIGDRLREQLPKLQAHGYAAGMNFAAPRPKPEAAKEVDGMRVGDTQIIYV